MRRIGLIAAAPVVVLAILGLAQLILPGLAAQRLRDRLSKSGTVLQVEVHAFPAIELLWQHADRVVIRMSDYHSSSSGLGSTLQDAGGVGTLDASATTLRAGLLTLRQASLHKRGRELTGSADVRESDLRSAVPFLDGVVPVSADNGVLTLRGAATVLGVTAVADAVVAPAGGHVVVRPQVPFGVLGTITAFSNPHVYVDSLSASLRGDGFSVAATGHLI